jgi:hypothetical protein
MYDTPQAFGISENEYEDRTSILSHAGSRLQGVNRRSSNLDRTLDALEDCTKFDGIGRRDP